MPRRPDTPCRRCGDLLWQGTGSLSQPMCQPCRRIEPQRNLGRTPLVHCPCGRPIRSRQHTRCYLCRDDKPSSAERGYGNQHRLVRAQLLAAFTTGQPCPRCHEPIHTGQPVDLDHTDDRSAYLGLSHSWCNRGKRSVPAPTQPTNRRCEHCQNLYTARDRRQRTCSRLCGATFRKSA